MGVPTFRQHQCRHAACVLSVINMERADTAAVTARFASKPPAPPHQKTSKVAERLGEGEMSGEAHTATQPEYVPRTHTIRSLQVRV
jgi:hypothetical protein